MTKQTTQKTKQPTKADLAARVKELEAKFTESYGSPAHAVINDDGSVHKLIVFDDPITAAVGSAVAETVFHPTGDVNDPNYVPDWIDTIRTKVSSGTGIRKDFIRVEFLDTDRTGAPLDDDNWVRIYVKVGDHERHLLLQDPTPED